MPSAAGRQVGVQIPQGQLSQGRAPEQTVTHAIKGEVYAIQYGDEYGKARIGICFKFGDVVYMDPNGEQWAAKLGPVQGWVKEGIEAKIAEQDTQVPTQDTVDVVGGGMANSEESPSESPSAT
jgi:hypothetical protein